MAKKKASSLLNSAKVYISEIDDAIEKDAYANADTIETESKVKKGYLKKAHEAIIEVLAIESTDDSKYYDYEVFHRMVNEKVKLRRERREKAEAKKAEVEAKEAKKEAE